MEDGFKEGFYFEGPSDKPVIKNGSHFIFLLAPNEIYLNSFNEMLERCVSVVLNEPDCSRTEPSEFTLYQLR